MKTIAVIDALEEEINSIKSEMEIISAKNIVGLDFIMGKMLGNNIVLVRSGMGKVNASICTQILIDMYAVDYVINVGVAGTLNNELSAADIIISDDVCYYDFDISIFGEQKGVIHRMDESFFKADGDLIAFAAKAIEDAGKNVNIGRIASGDRIINDDDEKNAIKNEFKALCIDMESCGIAHTCYLNKIPFVIISMVFDKLSTNITDVFSKTDISVLTQVIKNLIDIID